MSDLAVSGWAETTIKESSYLKGRIGWQGLKASEFTDHGPYLITGTDFHDGSIDWNTCYHVTEERFKEGAYIHVRDGDLLITKDGTIGKIAYVTACPSKAVLNSGIFLLRCSDGSYEHRFLYHLLNSHFFDTFLRLNLAGSTINHLYQNVFERFVFPVPDIRMQRRLVRILDSIDAQIEQTEALIAKYQQIKAGLMHDLFTRGVTPDGHLRPTRTQAPHLYKASTLGWIPKEWEVKPLSAFTQHDITYGIVQAGPHIENGVPYIRTGDMAGDRLVREELLCTSRIIADSYKRSEVRSGEIVCAIRATVGKVLRVSSDLDGANLTQGTARIAPSSKTDPTFLLWAIRSERTQRAISLSIKGTTFNEITLGELRRLPVAAPIEVLEQQHIGNRMDECNKFLEAESTRHAKLRQQKHGLMRDLLTGRVRVKVTEAASF